MKTTRMPQRVQSVHFNKRTDEIHLGSILNKNPNDYTYLGIHKFKSINDLIPELIEMIPHMGLEKLGIRIIEEIKQNYAEVIL